MTAVWVVREDGKVEAAFPREDDAVDYRHLYGAADMTVTRETLLTPAHAAVIDAAVAMVDDLTRRLAQPLDVRADTHSELAAAFRKSGIQIAVATLRELET